jgi:hypothetical protein
MARVTTQVPYALQEAVVQACGTVFEKVADGVLGVPVLHCCEADCCEADCCQADCCDGDTVCGEGCC